MNEVIAKTLRCASLSSTAAYSPGLLKPLFTLARFVGSMDSMPIKIQVPPAAAIRSTSSSSRRRLALICAIQWTCALAAIMSRSSDLVRFTLIAKLSSMKNTAILPPSLAAKRFVGHFRYVRSTHNNRHSGGADCVGHAVGLGDHSCHGADANEPDVLLLHVPSDSGFIHGLRVPVDQQYLMAGRRQRFEQKHP